MESFEPWIARLDKHMTEAALGEEAGHIPQSGTAMTGRRSSV